MTVLRRHFFLIEVRSDDFKDLNSIDVTLAHVKFMKKCVEYGIETISVYIFFRVRILYFVCL